MKHLRFRRNFWPGHFAAAHIKKFMAFAWVCLFAHAAMGQKEDEFCSFSANSSITCSGAEIRFTTAFGSAPYIWSFGDGTPDVTGNPPIFHTYVDVNPDLMPVTAMLSFPGDSCVKVVPFPGIFLGEGCGSQRTLGNLVTNNKLPANELVGKTVYLYGDLVVDIPYVFNGCTVFVSGGGKIRIVSGGALTLNNNTLMDALTATGPPTCQSLWNGIEVQTGGKLTTNGATIQNAYFAVSTTNPGNLKPYSNGEPDKHHV